MVRELVRPGEGHAMRSMRLEGLEAVMEHCRNALKQAEAQDDLRLARVYARQQDRAAAELLARRLEREERMRRQDPEDTMKPEIENGWNVEREAAQFRLMLQDGHITEQEYRDALNRLEDENGGGG